MTSSDFSFRLCAFSVLSARIWNATTVLVDLLGERDGRPGGLRVIGVDHPLRHGAPIMPDPRAVGKGCRSAPPGARAPVRSAETLGADQPLESPASLHRARGGSAL